MSACTSIKSEENNDETCTASSYLEDIKLHPGTFVILVKKLPNSFSVGLFRKFVHGTLKLRTQKLFRNRGSRRALYINFYDALDMERAIEILNATTWKGVRLEAEACAKKRKPPVALDKPLRQQIIEQTLPLWNIKYSEQLKKKQEGISYDLKRLGRKLFKLKEVTDWVAYQQRNNHALPCELMDPIYSPLIEGYRNKCEFTIGLRSDTHEKIVGFRVGAYADGNVGVGPIDELFHIPKMMRRAAHIFEQYVRASTFAVYNPVDQSGHFHKLTIRTTSDGQLMLIVGVFVKGLMTATVIALQRDLIAFFSDGDGCRAGVTSLYFQTLPNRKPNDDARSRPVYLHGGTHICERLLGREFRISPDTFFPVNTTCAEVLYTTVYRMARVDRSSTVIDMYRGIGMVGVCAASRADQVLIINKDEHSNRNTHGNVHLNNLTNVNFFHGHGIIGMVVNQARNDDIIAIVGPNLHDKVVMQLHKEDRIKKIIFITPKSSTYCDNFVNFARSARQARNIAGGPFVPTRVVMVDMNPSTNNFELVVLMERMELVPKLGQDFPKISEEMLNYNYDAI